MIYTITLNPALDYTLEVKDFNINKINKCKTKYILPGGKGINVSIILKRLDINSTAIGFISGFVGEEIKRQLSLQKIDTNFININSQNSRINVKILDGEKETAVNCKGPFIEKKYIDELLKKLDNLKNDDILVLSGSIPDGVDLNIYEKMCEKLKNKNIKIIVDSTKDLLLNTLKYNPFLIKPNQNEIEEIFNINISTKEQAIEYAKKLQQKGAKNVLVSMGGNGLVFLDENGNYYKQKAIKIKKIINTVGAGDSMVAGFLAGYLKYNDYNEALKLGISAATATVNSVYLGEKEEIIEYFNSF